MTQRSIRAGAARHLRLPRVGSPAQHQRRRSCAIPEYPRRHRRPRPARAAPANPRRGSGWARRPRSTRTRHAPAHCRSAACTAPCADATRRRRPAAMSPTPLCTPEPQQPCRSPLGRIVLVPGGSWTGVTQARATATNALNKAAPRIVRGHCG